MKFPSMICFILLARSENVAADNETTPDAAANAGTANAVADGVGADASTLKNLRSNTKADGIINNSIPKDDNIISNDARTLLRGQRELAWSGACPQAYTQKSYYAGELASYNGRAYQCASSPTNLFCGMLGFRPEVDQYWSEAWTLLGTCTGGGTPVVVNPRLGGCTGFGTWQHMIHTFYKEGDTVAKNGRVYRCKAYPYSSHCSQQGYEPETNPATPGAWRDAWELIGGCDGSITPTTGVLPTQPPPTAPTVTATHAPSCNTPTKVPTPMPTKSPTKTPICHTPTNMPTQPPTPSPSCHTPTSPPTTPTTTPPTTRMPSDPPTQSPTCHTPPPTPPPTFPPTNPPTTQPPTTLMPTQSPTPSPTCHTLPPTNPPTTNPPTTNPPTVQPPTSPPTTPLPTKSPICHTPTSPPTSPPTKSPSCHTGPPSVLNGPPTPMPTKSPTQSPTCHTSPTMPTPTNPPTPVLTRGEWYVSWGTQTCVQDCPVGLAGASCGGLAASWENKFPTAAACCLAKLPHKHPGWCKANSEAVNTNYPGSGQWYTSTSGGNKCVQDCSPGVSSSCGGIIEDSWVPLFMSALTCCQKTHAWVNSNTCLSASVGVSQPGTNSWYVDHGIQKCVQDCEGAAPCGGLKESWEHPHPSKSVCCGTVSWMTNCL